MKNPFAMAVLVAALVPLVRGPAGHADETSPYEPAPSIRAEDVLDKALLRGPHHEVESVVTTERFHHVFSLRTDFNRLRVPSRRLLEIRTREAETMSRVVGTGSGSEFFKSLGQSLASLPTAAVGVVLHPVRSAAQIGKGLGKTWRRTKDLFRGRPRSVYEDASATGAFRGDEKRELAADLGLDAYSSNPHVQHFLDRVASARAAGHLSLDAASIALPVVGFVAMTTAKWRADVRRLLRDHTPAELDRHNAQMLSGLGIPRTSWGPFLSNRWLSPRHRTVITAALSELRGVERLGAMLDAASLSRSELGALYHEQQVILLARHHEVEAALSRLHRVRHVVVATTRGGQLVAYLPVDQVYWTEGLERLRSDLHALAGSRPLELRVTGRVTERARVELMSGGIHASSWTPPAPASHDVQPSAPAPR